jgi:hypothetical protein
MDDLVTWLRDIWDVRERELDEDERVARAADGIFDDRDLADELIGEGFDPELAEHVARWDPARVLRAVATERADISAKRRILELHAPFVDYQGRTICEHCANLCHSRSGLGCDDPDAPYPCDTVRLVALSLAERDGYRQEWRPGAPA